MLLIPCPHCGPRAEIEFRHAGEAHLKRVTEDVRDQDWGAYLYTRVNPRGPHAERWRHVHGCGQFFNLVRDTVSDKVLDAAPQADGGGRPSPGVEHAKSSGDAL